MGYHSLPAGLNPPESVTCVIEVPKGGSLKFEFDEEHEIFRLDRVLHSPLFYPCDYGFIPGTRSDDGDHLDVLVVVTLASFTGAVMEARPVGMLKMTDDKGKDYKILAVPKGDPRFRHVYDLPHLSQHILAEIGHFFEIYKSLEKKQVNVEGWEGAESAKAEVLRSMEKYQLEG